MGSRRAPGGRVLAGSGSPAARERLRLVLAGMAEGAVVLVDGLVASAVPEVLVPQSRRLRVVVLLHLPFSSGTTPTPRDARVRCSLPLRRW